MLNLNIRLIFAEIKYIFYFYHDLHFLGLYNYLSNDIKIRIGPIDEEED